MKNGTHASGVPLAYLIDSAQHAGGVRTELKRKALTGNYKYFAPDGAQNPVGCRRFVAGISCCVLIAAFIWSGLFPRALAQSQTDDLPGVAEMKKGDYENAIKLLTARLATNADDAEAEKSLVRAYLETGRYLEAETAAKKFLLKKPAAAGVRHELAEVYASTGRYAEAITEFERAGTDAGKSPAEKLSSDLRRAELLELTGQEDRARPIFEALVAYYKDKQPNTAAELTAVGRALVHLERYQDANDVYREAIEADATWLDAQLSAGELFTDKYNYGDAAQFFADALQVNPNSARALVGVARNKRIDGGEETFNALTRALEINPNLVGALTFKAGVELEERDYVQATADIEKAFRVNPRSLDAHAVKAAMLYLQDRDYEPEVAAALTVNPRYGLIFSVLSHYATMTRRTAQAAAFAKRAIEISPRLWSAHLDLGMALLRLGQMPGGRAEVEKSFQGDPYNVWAKNTLDLLDAMKDYRETKH
ncbi:MAG TPA: tetratricopeptide repeat protein, partial [Pyrinomonadaceae bacterium]|nr:tetratricopeptide repeat protein [Pyrinomonadaceae bacterium]